MSKHSFNIARGARKQQPEGDASLGLTEAFAPIGAGDALEHRGAADGDTSLGLTEAFAPVAHPTARMPPASSTKATPRKTIPIRWKA